MLRLNALLSVLVLALSACIESPPQSSQPIKNADMANDSDPQSDMGGDIDEPICFWEGDCANGKFCKVDEENSNLNECVVCVDADDCGDPRLTCSDANECIGCLAGGTCPAMANRCDPESEAPGTCVECLGDENDTLCGDRPCDPESRRCVPCLPGDDSADIDDTCSGNAANKHCKVDDDDSLENKCVECLTSSDCARGGCDTNTNTCVNCVEDRDCEGEFVCTQEADLDVRMCVPCLGDSCDTGVCKEDLSDPSQNTCVECLVKDDCSGDDVCNPATNLCVECVSSVDCAGVGGFCDTDNTCVGCLSNTDCPGEVCDTSIKQCVECLRHADCTGTTQCRVNTVDSTENACVTCVNNNGCQSPSASLCNVGAATCGQCQVLAHCTHLGASYKYCDGGCIECYGLTEATDCGGNFCDLTTNMCTGTPIPASPTTNLGVCTSSSECRAGSRCMPLQYNGNPLGNFCMPLGDPNQTCPRDGTQAYLQKDLRSPIEGSGNVLFCRLDESDVTPQAVLESGKTCATNAECFATGSTCQQRDLATNRNCAYLCEDDSECKAGSTCRCPPSLNCALAGAPKYCLPPS